jgi:hypothetical protein
MAAIAGQIFALRILTWGALSRIAAVQPDPRGSMDELFGGAIEAARTMPAGSGDADLMALSRRGAVELLEILHSALTRTISPPPSTDPVGS